MRTTRVQRFKYYSLNYPNFTWTFFSAGFVKGSVQSGTRRKQSVSLEGDGGIEDFVCTSSSTPCFRPQNRNHFVSFRLGLIKKLSLSPNVKHFPDRTKNLPFYGAIYGYHVARPIRGRITAIRKRTVYFEELSDMSAPVTKAYQKTTQAERNCCLDELICVRCG